MPDPAETALHFATPEDLWAWFAANHVQEKVLIVRIFRKETGVPSVTWADCVMAGLAWGWIDGVKAAGENGCWFQRMTPRKARSMWSQKNRENALRLIAEGRMQPAGMAQVTAAQADGRWDTAYAGSKDMVIPQDFLDALAAEPAAAEFYATLDRRNLFPIYHRLQTAKRPETRAKRIAAMVAQLARGERFH